MKKTEITIGIAAHNEEKNIEKMLRNIIAQRRGQFVLKKIIVVSDGSSDATDKKVLALKNPLIKLVADGKRKGKAARVNQIMKLTKTEILVLLDADVELANLNVIEKLITPFAQDKNVVITSGGQRIHTPKTSVQRIIQAGSIMWDKVTERKFGSGAYYCSGGIRAFRRSFYTRFSFPKIKAEDVYPYLYCKKHRMGEFQYVPEAAIYYSLPRTFRDFLSQTRRYLTAIEEQENYFDHAFIAQEFTITPLDKLMTLLTSWVSNPFWISLYFFLNVYAHIDAFFQPRRQEAVWSEVRSSK